MGGPRRPGRLADQDRRRPQGQEDRRDQGHRPVLLPAPVARGGRAQRDRRDRRGAPARRRLGGPPERLRRRVGGPRSDHGRRRGGRARRCSTGTSASTATASSTPPSRSSPSEPDVAQAVVDAYEQARAWAQAQPRGDRAILSEEAGLDIAVATKVITERSNLDVDPVPGDAQRDRARRRSARSSSSPVTSPSQDHDRRGARDA